MVIYLTAYELYRQRDHSDCSLQYTRDNEIYKTKYSRVKNAAEDDFYKGKKFFGRY